MRLQPFVPDHATARSQCRGAAALGALMTIMLHPARASDAHAPAPTSAAASHAAVPRTAKAAAPAGHAPAVTRAKPRTMPPIGPTMVRVARTSGPS